MTRTRAPGFTIIELMIVLIIVAVLAAVAAPSMRDVVVRMRVKTAAGDLHTSLLFARSEAVKRNANITLSPIGGGSNWAVGWEVRSGATVLSRQDPYPSVTFTTFDAAYTPATLSAITYAGNGRETGSAGAGIAFVLTAAEYPSIAARCVLIAPSGRPTVRTDGNGDPTDGC